MRLALNLVGEDFIFSKLIIIRAFSLGAVLGLGYIRLNFGITLWCLNREERFLN
jgi:hypothetical protein